MNTKVIGISIAAFIGIIVLGSVLMPILDDATATTDTLTNEGYFRMTKITADDTNEYTLTWVKSTDTFTLNGVEVNIGDHSQYTNALGISIAMTDKSVSRYVSLLRIQSWTTGTNSSMGFSQTSTEITFNNGVQTITVDKGLETENVRTVDYEVAYVISNDGDCVMKKSTQTAYVLGDSELFAVGRTNIDTSSDPIQATLKMTGNASDVEFSALNGVVDPTFSDVNISKTENSSYVGLYDLDKVTATVTYDSTDTGITYSYFVVPHEVTAEKAVHFTNGQNALFMVIPMLIIVAILIGVVALVVRSKLE